MLLSRQALAVTAMAAVVSLSQLAGCSNGTTVPVSAGASRLIDVDDFVYAGAFALPAETYGVSSANWARGAIEVSGNSIYLAGHEQHDAIAEFRVPDLVDSRSINDLNYAQPVQNFVSPIARVQGGNPQSLDHIVGLERSGDALIVNAVEYYDAPADNFHTTFVIENANDLALSSVSSMISLQGRARAGGWISPLPPELQSEFQCTHISGNSSGDPILSRHSVGPSAFCFNIQDVTSSGSAEVVTTELLGFSEMLPLQADLFNDGGNNKQWTHLSAARFGFIVPGTQTYATFGHSGGHASRVHYKFVRDNGYQCPGYCSEDPNDVSNYYWLWDVDDMRKVHSGELRPSELHPYAFGKLEAPFQTGLDLNEIGGGSWDAATGTLYLSILRANNTLDRNHNPPIIVAYKLKG